MVWPLPEAKYRTMTHFFVAACQMTFGSRLPGMICRTTGFWSYLMKLRPSRLYAKHCVVGSPAAVKIKTSGGLPALPNPLVLSRSTTALPLKTGPIASGQSTSPSSSQ